jgi:serine/threonine-protein kinase
MSTKTVEWVGQKLAAERYVITAKLGEGGMGAVYRAWDENLEAEVVIKVPKRSMLDDPEFAGRFQREIRSLVKLSHPNIVKIQDVGECDGLPYCVMQCLSGGDLKERCTRSTDGQRQPMPVTSLGTWLPKVADALDFIHQQNFVHRDVKPANILFDAHDNAYLSDFGVAKVIAEKAPSEASLTGTGMVLGTPEYMAPEMVLGEKFDGRVDQYALAVTVYEVLTAGLPLSGPTPSAILVKQTTETPRPLCDVAPVIPRALSQAVMKALAKKPEERFADCRSFAQAVLAGITGAAQPVKSDAVSDVVQGVAGLVARAVSDTARSLAKTAESLKVTSAGSTTAPGDQPQTGLKKQFLGLWLDRRNRLWLLSIAAVVILGWPLWRSIRSRTAIPVFSGPIGTSPIGQPSVFPGVNRPTDPPGIRREHPNSAKNELTNSAKTGSPKLATTADPRVALTPEEAQEAIPLAEHAADHDFTNSMGIRMIAIRPGRFQSLEDSGWSEFDKPFWIAKYEVTVAEYLHYCEASSKGKSEYPVWLQANRSDSVDKSASKYFELREDISRNGAPVVGLTGAQMSSFCRWLSQRSEEPLTYSLPSPKQWECAYRAGTNTTFYWGDRFDEAYANLKTSNDPFASVAPVGRLQPNAWGLHDMAGNVWEMTGNSTTVMGGGWDSSETNDARPLPTTRPGPASSVGFRLVGVAKQ